MTPLYSIRTDGDQWRITKFVDGDVESSYLTTHSECQCPAGHRQTCRHRQMLPSMLAHGLCDTHWFFCFDTGGQIVDFNGTSKHLLDQLAEGSQTQEETVQDTLSLRPKRQTFTVPEGYEAIRDAEGRATGEVQPVLAGQHCQENAYGTGPMMHDLPRLKVDNERERSELAAQGSKSWRRL